MIFFSTGTTVDVDVDATHTVPTNSDVVTMELNNLLMIIRH